MNKHIFKEIILTCNTFSLDVFSKESLIEHVSHHLNIDQKDVLDCLTFIENCKGLEWLEERLDFMPITIMYAKSYTNSPLEALCAFAFLKPVLKEHNISLSNLENCKLPSISILKSTCFFSQKEELKEEIEDIFTSNEFIPFTLEVHFIKEVHNLQIPLKNKESKMISYPHLTYITKHMPDMGIPQNRDASKEVATFFKDTLMHEFDRECPLCKINFPHMLIASHIKPFRDCAHIFEAGDYHNGILLCKNHDFLFDQGYISFEEDGTLLISSKLPKPYENFYLQNLESKYLTTIRKEFLKYHREHIFQK